MKYRNKLSGDIQFYRHILLKTGVCLLMVFTATLCQAKSLDAKAQSAVNALYHFRFHEADSIIGELEKQYPAHYLPSVARAQYYWWKLISQSANDSLKQQYLQSLLHAESLIKHDVPVEDSDFNDLFFLINIYASRARLDLMNQDYFKTMRHLAKSASFISLTLHQEDAFSPFLLTSGLYNYMVGHGEEIYPFFRWYSLRYPKGNKMEGIEQLKKAAHGDNLLIKTEANYFLMKIYTEIEEDYQEALPYVHWLTDTYPDNLIFLHHYYEVMNQLNRKNASEQIRISFFQSLQENQQLNSQQVVHLRELL